MSVRAILHSRRIITRSVSTPWAKWATRHNSTQPTASRERDALDKETDSSTRAIPLTGPSTDSHAPSALETPLPEAASHTTVTPNSPPSSQASSTHDSRTTPPGEQAEWKKNLSSYDLDLVKSRIRDWTEQAAVTFRDRADELTNHTKTRFSQLGGELSKATGYEEIEVLKKEVVEQEERIKATRQAAKQAKLAYEQSVIRRSESQREVNELLQRKSYWNDADLARFTDIVRQDHSHEQEESRAKAAVDETESAVEREFTQLLKSILARYHEEQVWSDKIRSMSTYGSLAALGLNLLVFILAILIVEPWKRRRLAQTFETKIEELSVENAMKLEESMKQIGGKFTEQEHLLSDILDEIVALKGVQAKIVGMQEAEMRGMEMQPNQVIAPSLGEPAAVSIPGLYVTLPQRTFELAAIGVGAFVLGVISVVLTE
ncbi:hypothetical protein Agabi119p4_7357 [Agaricus bisporus var. burnettii]|uniref:Sensitive to high expression protein 9, mitochondrial n=1 Tax=Agaricus bisporus var. burnettii TaxID=192524 RepID=A0A8H7C6Q0_AGABI|nr:hypothetical protein Agabi119p4_7357 [Agaricus bisporus var. burnettii]